VSEVSEVTDRIEIGKVCYKGGDGGHFIFVGDSGYGVCGTKEYATVYASIELDYPNPRGESKPLEELREEIARMVAGYEVHGWCNYDETTGPDD
jgi:hypothetical protein